MGVLNIAVSANSVSATKAEINARGFQFHIDEPQALGGTDSAANPVEYLLGAYAGCLNVMAHLIAKEQDIAIDNLSIDISGELDTDKLFGSSQDVRAGFQNIKVVFNPKTNASADKLASWLKAIDDRCPINDNLKNLTPVKLLVAN